MEFIVRVSQITEISNKNIAVIYITGVVYDRYRTLLLEVRKNHKLQEGNYLLIDSSKWRVRSLEGSIADKIGIDYEIVSYHIPGYIDNYESQLDGNSLELMRATQNKLTFADYIKSIDKHTDSL